MRKLCICLLACAYLNLTACASLPAPSALPPPPANLRQPCQDLSAPTDGTSGQMLKWSLETIEAYKVCQDRHKKLVESWPK